MHYYSDPNSITLFLTLVVSIQYNLPHSNVILSKWSAQMFSLFYYILHFTTKNCSPNSSETKSNILYLPVVIKESGFIVLSKETVVW